MSASLATRAIGLQSRLDRCRALACVLLGLLLGQTALADLGRFCEYRTSDFRIISDLDRPDVEDLVGLLGRFKQIATPYLPGSAVSNPGQSKFIIFEQRRDFLRLTGKRKFSGFMQPSLETNRLLIGPVRGDLVETTLHEYAHYLLRNRLDVSLPVWFDEGLAMLLGNIRFTDTEAVVGRLDSRHMSGLVNDTLSGTSGALPGVKTILTTDSIESWSPSRIQAFYDFSWLLTHYLHFGHPAGQSDHQEQLNSYLSYRDGDIADYLGVSHRGLLRLLQNYLKERPDSHRLPSAPGTADSAARFECLSEAQRDHELAKALLNQNPETAAELLKTNTSTEDALVLVTRSRIERSLGDTTASLATAERAYGIDPDSPETMINLADRRVHGCLFKLDEACQQSWEDGANLYRRALGHDPSRIDAVSGLGLAYLYTNRPGEAVNYMRVAYARAPWSAAINFYLGESYRLIGDSRAEMHLLNARNWADANIWRALATESLKLLHPSASAPARD